MTNLEPSLLERLRLFVASPSDVAVERSLVPQLAEELNRGVAADAGYILEVVRWETHATPDMGRPQQLILNQIGEYDIFIGIMWTRFGTPTGIAGSGTEEEFNNALASWSKKGRPRMLCYFGQAQINVPRSVKDAEQLVLVKQFQEHVESRGLCSTYSSPPDFKDKLREHLQSVIKEFAVRRPPLDRNLVALLDIEKERCRELDIMFMTPNLLLSLLSRGSSSMRPIFEQAYPQLINQIIDGLQQYRPHDGVSNSTSFSEFDWYDRDDVQAARRRAKNERRPVIDAQHLLLGFLDTESETRAQLSRLLGDDGLNRLRAIAEAYGRAYKTPGVIFKPPPSPAEDA
jgi:hypothetical protein